MALNLSEYNPESTKTTYTGRQLCVWAIDFIKSCLVSRSESERPSFMRYIAGRPELTWNKLSKPKHRLDFSSLDFREHSLDPFFFRFQKLEDKALDELEGYIGLADRYPRYFAEVQKATLIEDDSSSKCQGILCARNYASYTLFMTCKTGFQPSDDLQGYINMQVNEIAGLLAVEGYVIEDGDLEKHLQVWRDSKGSDFLVRLGFLSEEHDLPMRNKENSVEINKDCVENFRTHWWPPNPGHKIDLKRAQQDMQVLYIDFELNTVPLDSWE